MSKKQVCFYKIVKTILKAIAADAAQLLLPAFVQNLVIFFKGKAGAARPAAQPDLASCFFDYERTVAR